MKTFTPFPVLNNFISASRNLFLLLFSVLTFATGFSQGTTCTINTNFLHPATDIVYPTCPAASGSITLALGSFQPPYTVELLYGPSSLVILTPVLTRTNQTSVEQTFSNLKSGYYCIRYTDAAGCVVTRDVPLICKPGNNIICTYTQGYYGNAGGKSCDEQGNKNSTIQLITKSLQAWGGTLVIGKTGVRSLTISVSEANRIFNVLPGGGPSSSFKHNGNITLTFLALKGRIRNSLLAQTITLGLNLKGLNSALAGVPLNNPAVSYSISIHSAVANSLSSKTVLGLFELANKALAGEPLPVKINLSMISDAVDRVNNAYNGCITTNGNTSVPYSCDRSEAVKSEMATEEVKMASPGVTTYPNPYRSRIYFTLSSPQSGQATLELYNASGIKIATLYQGYFTSGKGQTVEYSVPALQKGTLYYLWKVGPRQVSGKLLSAQ